MLYILFKETGKWEISMTKRQEKAQVTKEKIIKAAEILLKENCFENISVEDITKYADIAKGTFYIYFKRKEDVIYEIGYAVFRDLAEKVENMKDEAVEQKVYAYFKGTILLIEKYGINLCRQWIKDVINPNDMGNAEYTKWHFDTDVFKKILKEAVVKGELKQDMPVDTAAYLIISQIYGMMTCWCMSDGEFEFSKWIDKFFNLNILSIINQYKN